MFFLSSKNKLVLKDRLFSALYFASQRLLPVFVFLIVFYLQLPFLAYILILLSKWRIFTVTPRLWWENLNLNAVDLIVGFSITSFMSWPTLSFTQQFIWFVIYMIWVLLLKSITQQNGHLLQGIIAQGLGTSVLIYYLNQLNLPLVLGLIWFVAILCTQHILAGFDFKNYHRYLIHLWGLFSLQLSWVLLHWSLNFWIVPRLAFLQVLVLIIAAVLYSLHLQNRLSRSLKIQLYVSGAIIIFVILFLSNLGAVSI